MAWLHSPLLRRHFARNIAHTYVLSARCHHREEMARSGPRCSSVHDLGQNRSTVPDLWLFRATLEFLCKASASARPRNWARLDDRWNVGLGLMRRRTGDLMKVVKGAGSARA